MSANEQPKKLLCLRCIAKYGKRKAADIVFMGKTICLACFRHLMRHEYDDFNVTEKNERKNILGGTIDGKEKRKSRSKDA